MKYERWELRPGRGDARRALEQAGLPPLCAAVLSARGLDAPEKAEAFLRNGPELLHDPFLLRDMDKAVRRIARALEEGEAIAVYGDYDVDGITATALLTEFLRQRGGRVVSYIPDRIEEGYGLNRTAVKRLYERGVRLIVTVDCGITAVAEVAYARQMGVDVVVTDHHHCKAELPGAAAVVDPRRPDCGYPFSELAGVGVALKTALALTPLSEREAVLSRYMDLAAVGTVADVMRLTDENRAIVTMGLRALARERRPGLLALLEEVNPNRAPLTASTIGYGLAPRINAAGRMERAEVALELLLTQDPRRGRALAQELCEMNRERQRIESDIFEECQRRLEDRGELLGPAIVLAGEGWHQGVVGIVASRLAEKYARPAFMICLEKGRGKGSCRSFGGFHLFAALDACAPLLDEYGGHALAAGFTIREENIPAFTASINAQVDAFSGGQPLLASLDVDAEIDNCSRLTCAQVDALELLEPFGTGNPKPVFLLRGASVSACADVGGGRHLKLRVRRDGRSYDAIFFSANAAGAGVRPGDRVDLAFTPQINEFRGRRDVQLQLSDLRAAPTRAQAELAVFERFCAGAALTAREAALLLPERDDFAHLWRWLQRACAAGPAAGPPERLARCAVRCAPQRRSYARTMVCFRVLDERGLIRVEGEGQLRVSLCKPERKVDLEQSELMKRLRAFLEAPDGSAPDYTRRQ